MAFAFPTTPVDITKNHSVPLATAKQKAEAVAQQLKQKYPGMQYAWQGDKITFQITSGEGNGVKGFLAVTTSTITIHMDLPFMIGVLKGVIVDKINEYFRGVGIV